MTDDDPTPRYRLPSFRRFRPGPATELSPDDPAYYVPTPEDFLPSPPRPRSPLSQLPNLTHLRPALLCFVLFWVTSLHDWRGLGYTDLGATGADVLVRHEYWRLLTALFDHADVGHLAANTPLFLIFGWYLRAFFGWLAFPCAALVIGVLSNLVTVYFYPPDVELIGASGMLYGMVALWLVLYVRFEALYSPGMRLFRAVGVSLLLLFPTTFEKSVSYLAHVSGFAIGLVVGLALIPFLRISLPAAPPSPPPAAPPSEPLWRVTDNPADSHELGETL